VYGYEAMSSRADIGDYVAPAPPEYVDSLSGRVEPDVTGCRSTRWRHAIVLARALSSNN